MATATAIAAVSECPTAGGWCVWGSWRNSAQVRLLHTTTKLELSLFTVLGSNGPIGLTRESNFSNGIAVGRVGASGSVHCVREAVWLSDNVLFVEPSAGVWNLSYLYNALQGANLPELASKTAQPLLTQRELGAVKILLPPLPEQRAIAAVLDRVDVTLERAREERGGLQLPKESTADALLTGRVRV